MASSTDFPARGKITEVREGVLVFQPSNTNYELHLQFADDAKPQVSPFPVEVLIRVDARKTYTVPSGGNFITPIFGQPKIIQGRVKYADEKIIVVHAGCPIIVRLPDADTAIDLSEGKIQVGHMANVVALPGAKVELVAAAASAA
jgi:hypothetical protein